MQWTDESIAFLRDAPTMNRYYETIAERIAPQLQENAHVCDAGCGIGELEALTPKEPYDAMVFCLFGRTEDTLRIAKKQCRGKIFLVKSDYSHHRFSAGKVSLGEYTAGSAASASRR